jgi:hypothetical protein
VALTETTPRVAICAIAKNESAYLEEWVAYHHLIGFDPIRIYSHEPTDDSEEVLERLARKGIAEWVPWTAPPDKKPQWVAYEDGLAQLRDRADWIAFIDLDEFVVIPEHASIQAFLADYGHLEAIAINWKMFGSSGHDKHEPGLVIERFTRCAMRSFSGNHAVKTLARIDAVEIPRVHTCHFREGVTYQTVSGEEIPEMVGKSEVVTHNLIRLNHYFTRSREEWDNKAKRGRGAKPANHPLKHRQEHEFHNNDRNEREEIDILAYIPKVKAFLRDELGVEVEDAPAAPAPAARAADG